MLIQPRRGTSDQWVSANPILAVGEMGYETDTRKFKYGDGLSTWLDLPYGISAANLSDASGIGVELLTAETVEEARTILNIGTGTSVNASDIVDSTSLGRSVLTAATATAAQTALGGTTVGRGVFAATDAEAARTAISAGTYSVPSGGIPATDLAETVQTSLELADSAIQTVTALSITNSSAVGRSVLTAVDATDARNAIGAGTSSLILGTTSTTALAGNYAPTAANISDSTSVGRSLITASSALAARAVIGAGTSNLALGTTSTTALAGDYAPTATSISDSTETGRLLLTAEDAEAALGVLGITSTGGIASVAAADITDATTVGVNLITATDAEAARTAIGAGTGNYSRPSTGIPSDDLSSAVQSALASAGTALQSVNAAAITDSTAVGRSLLTAASAAAALTALGGGTYSKPSTGIPLTDLTATIQTSLGLANTALQTVNANAITDATTTGRNVLRATDAATARTAIGAGSYTRPSTGIPLTDLASTVQSSIAKADSALQAVSAATISDATTTGRAVLRAADAAAARTAIGAGTYSRPSTGIPSTDLATTVQSNLTLASSALQTVSSSTISDASTTGRSLLTATSATAARTTLGAYARPSTGIPESDLASAVQTSLSRADVAVAGSVNGTATALTLWTGTAAQYAAIGTKSSTTVYVVT